MTMDFHKDILTIDCVQEAQRISEFIRDQTQRMRRGGAVIGLSGGIDSAVAAEFCVRALGSEKVLGLILPERDSHPLSEQYAGKQAQKMGIRVDTIDITPTLEGFGTYERRDEVVKEIFPEYNSHYKLKISLPPDLLSRDAFNFFTLTIDDGRGKVKSARLKRETFLGIVAATNTKQRARMMHLYYRAEKMNYFVCGTTNKTENVQGFFVKYGDGGVDIEPIAHLYKTQVYQLAEHLGVIQEIVQRTPSPDTYSFHVSDDEFYFRMPYEKLDLLLYAWENKVPVEDICKVMDLAEDQIKRAFRDFAAKYHATEHLRRLAATLSS
jgi:NAD+ synthase